MYLLWCHNHASELSGELFLIVGPTVIQEGLIGRPNHPFENKMQGLGSYDYPLIFLGEAA